MPLVAAMTRDALAVLRTATSGDGDGDDDALVALVAERVAERLRGGRADTPLELTTYDLSVLVEAALIDLRELTSRRPSCSAAPWCATRSARASRRRS